MGIDKMSLVADQGLPHQHNSNTEYMLRCEPDEETFMSSAEIFRQISDVTRLKILWLLCHSEDCVINIAAAMNMSSPAVSHHLRILKSAGLISSRREGKETYYTLAKNKEAQFLHDIIDRTFNIKCR